jgi:Ca2+-binding EF-hand superfamily protein
VCRLIAGIGLGVIATRGPAPKGTPSPRRQVALTPYLILEETIVMQRLTQIAVVAFCAGIGAQSAFAQPDGVMPGFAADDAANKFIEQLDTDGSGDVTLDEALAPQLERFGSTDANGDKAITADEADAAFKAQVPPEMLEAMEERGMTNPGQRFIGGLDQNGDGKVDEDEFKAPSQASFEAMDTSADGKADKDEAKAYFEELGAKMQKQIEQMRQQMPEPPAAAE